jgi:hypothetical protein
VDRQNLSGNQRHFCEAGHNVQIWSSGATARSSRKATITWGPPPVTSQDYWFFGDMPMPPAFTFVLTFMAFLPSYGLKSKERDDAMLKIQSKTFGAVEIDPEDGLGLQLELLINGRKSDCFLFVNDNVSGKPDKLEQAFLLLDKIEELDQRARQEMTREYRQGNELIAYFVDFHLEELSEEVLSYLSVESCTPLAFLERLHIRGIGVHDREDGFELAIDYCIDPSISDELLVVSFNPDAAIVGITHES